MCSLKWQVNYHSYPYWTGSGMSRCSGREGTLARPRHLPNRTSNLGSSEMNCGAQSHFLTSLNISQHLKPRPEHGRQSVFAE